MVHRSVGFTRIKLTSSFGSDTVFIYQTTGRLSFVGSSVSFEITPKQLGDIFKTVLFSNGTIETVVKSDDCQEDVRQHMRDRYTINGKIAPTHQR